MLSENIAKLTMNALIGCPHTINDDEIVLRFSEKQDGHNALNQLTRRIEAALSAAEPQCCMCGKKGLSTAEGDGGSECELSDGRWVCSAECWDRAVEPAPSVAVKALEWDDSYAINEDQEEAFVASKAKSPFEIEYHIEFDPFHNLDWVLSLVYPIGSYATPEAAKAAAQDDYEARIRSALSAQVQDVAAGVMASIAEERKRQIAKGYDVSHDDAHDTYEIIDASWGAAARINVARSFRDQHNISGYKAALIQAAAQIVAEIERLDRAAAPAKQEDGE